MKSSLAKFLPLAPRLTLTLSKTPGSLKSTHVQFPIPPKLAVTLLPAGTLKFPIPGYTPKVAATAVDFAAS